MWNRFFNKSNVIVNNQMTGFDINFDCKGYPPNFDFSGKNAAYAFSVYQVTTEQFEDGYEKMLDAYNDMKNKWNRVYVEITMKGILKSEIINLKFHDLASYHAFLINNTLISQYKTHEPK